MPPNLKTGADIVVDHSNRELRPVNSPVPIVSVVICTYNRAERLLLALEALEKQTLSSQTFEILVIDNCSTDNTAKICESFRPKLENFHYLYEPIQGLSKARNSGWKAARGQYIAFLDDDAIPCPEWVESILTVFETVQPQPIGVGGPICPLWEIPRPDWLASNMEMLFTILDGGNLPRWFGEHEYPLGANVVYRRDALESVGGFCEQLGRKGQNLLSGEEMLLNETLTVQGERFYYSPQASVLHWIPKERINPEWLIQRSYWQGCSVAVQDQILGRSVHYQRLSSTWNLLRHFLSLTTIVPRFWFSPKKGSQIRLSEQVKLVLSWQWGYCSKTWFG